MNDKTTFSDKTTHFGYEQVKVADKNERVGRVFSSVASKYNIMNDAMSFGIHRLWKRYAMSLTGLRAGQQALDVAGGSGDLTHLLAKQVGLSGHVVLADINADMLSVGRSCLEDKGHAGNIHYVQANAEALAFPNNYFHCITIGFGLRNVTHQEKALASMYRCLKPGGRLLILEFSKPTSAMLKSVYDTYSFKLLPKMGKVIANDEDSYRYLAESIRMHPDQNSLKAMMEDVGFESCEYFNLTGGIVAVHRGYKF